MIKVQNIKVIFVLSNQLSVEDAPDRWPFLTRSSVL